MMGRIRSTAMSALNQVVSSCNGKNSGGPSPPSRFANHPARNVWRHHSAGDTDAAQGAVLPAGHRSGRQAEGIPGDRGRLRSLTDELERRPLHPVATAAIRHCLTLIERCGSVPADGSDNAPAGPQTQVAAIAERLTELVNDRRCA